MQVAPGRSFTPHLAAGVAVAGAVLIAGAPLVVPTIERSGLSVEQRALQLVDLVKLQAPDPWMELFRTTSYDAHQLYLGWAHDPLPVVSQLETNDIATVQDFVKAGEGDVDYLAHALFVGMPEFAGAEWTDVLNGRIDGAVTNWYTAAADSLQYFAGPGDSANSYYTIANAMLLPVDELDYTVYETLDYGIPEYLVPGFLNPFDSLVYAMGSVDQSLYNEAGDPLAMMHTFVDAPAILLNAFLNGDGPYGTYTGSGLLSPLTEFGGYASERGSIGTLASIMEFAEWEQYELGRAGYEDTNVLSYPVFGQPDGIGAVISHLLLGGTEISREASALDPATIDADLTALPSTVAADLTSAVAPGLADLGGIVASLVP